MGADRPNMREQLLAKAVEKKQACGSCDYCLDKPKFGGPNTKRRKCRQRTCIYYRQSQNSSRKRQNGHSNFRLEQNSLMASLNPSFLNSNFGKSGEGDISSLKGSDSITTTLAQQITNVAMA